MFSQSLSDIYRAESFINVLLEHDLLAKQYDDLRGIITANLKSPTIYTRMTSVIVYGLTPINFSFKSVKTYGADLVDPISSKIPKEAKCFY